MNSDLIYELSKYLDFPTLKSLCYSNVQYSKICQEERFQTLLRNKYQVETIYSDVKNYHMTKYTFIYIPIYDFIFSQKYHSLFFNQKKRLWNRCCRNNLFNSSRIDID